MYARSFAIYPYMTDVPFRQVVNALHEHYRAAELMDTAGRALAEDTQKRLRLQFIQGLGSRLFTSFSVCRMAAFSPEALPGPVRTEGFAGVIRSLDMDKLLAQVHQLLSDLVPRLREQDLDLCDLYEGQSIKFAFLPSASEDMPERLFWMRGFGLAGSQLLSECVGYNTNFGEDEASIYTPGVEAGLPRR